MIPNQQNRKFHLRIPFHVPTCKTAKIAKIIKTVYMNLKRAQNIAFVFALPTCISDNKTTSKHKVYRQTYTIYIDQTCDISSCVTAYVLM